MLSKVDDHGVTEYRKGVLLAITIISLSGFINGMGYLLYLLEVGSNGPIQTLRDATWTILMSMSTIGFGDYYSVTDAGRWLVGSAFVIGTIHFGTMITLLSSMTGADKDIQNRELRTQLSEVMRKLEQMEEHFNMDVTVSSDSHLLDTVFDQKPYHSNRLVDGWITMGKDSSGVYMLSIEAYDIETGREYRRWIPAYSHDDLQRMFDRILKNEGEI